MGQRVRGREGWVRGVRDGSEGERVRGMGQRVRGREGWVRGERDGSEGERGRLDCERRW